MLKKKAITLFNLNGRSLRINHNILATNYFLKKIKIIDDAKCNFCQNENETIEHNYLSSKALSE
jgi:hypothetical protein